MSEKTLVFCDGSSLNNNSKKGDRAGGIGVFFGDNDTRNISEVITLDKITNQVAELLACIKALYILKNDNYKGFVYIYTDSSYVINCMISYCKKWEKQGWLKEDKSQSKMEYHKRTAKIEIFSCVISTKEKSHNTKILMRFLLRRNDNKQSKLYLENQ